MGEKKIKLPKFSYNSPFILTYTIVALVALIINTITGGLTNTYLFSVYRSSLADPLFYIRLFGHAIGHASLSHYVGNFTIILLIGPMLEEKYGSKNLLIMSLITAGITGIIQCVFFANVGLLGASGVAFMMILLSSFTGQMKKGIPLTVVLVAILYLGDQVIEGLFTSDNISQLGHLIGGACGCLFGWFIGKNKT